MGDGSGPTGGGDGDGVELKIVAAIHAGTCFLSPDYKQKNTAGALPAQPQECSGQQINDFLVRVPWPVSSRREGDGPTSCMASLPMGKRLSRLESRGLRLNVFRREYASLRRSMRRRRPLSG